MCVALTLFFFVLILQDEKKKASIAFTISRQPTSPHSPKKPQKKKMSLYPVLCFQCEQTIDDKIRTARKLVSPKRSLDQVIQQLYPDLEVCCIEKILCSIETIERQMIGSAPIKIKPTIASMKFRPQSSQA